MKVIKKMAIGVCIIGSCLIAGQAIAGHGPGDGTGNGGTGPGDGTGHGPGTGDCPFAAQIFLKKTYTSISGIKGGEWKISALFKFGAG